MSYDADWIPVADWPPYYRPVWVTDGTRVELAVPVGRSHRPKRQEWRAYAGVGGLVGLTPTHWARCDRPRVPKGYQLKRRKP